MRTIKETFNIMLADVISITGAGGKTSLMYLLGEELNKVLLTTTTKIYKPNTNNVYINKIPSIDGGTFVMGKKVINNKIIGYDESELFDIIQKFDYTLIEADGSNEMSLKGWNDTEPVIHSFSNKTIGVLDITTLNKKISEEVFRLDEFKKITECDDLITQENLRDVVLHENGLFKNSNFKILFINKVESEVDRINSIKLVEILKEDNRFNIDKIVIGSVLNNSFESVYEKMSLYVLASGKSKRMEIDKLLVDYKEKKLIEHTLSKLSSYHYDKYVVCNDDRLLDLSEKYGFKYLINSKNELGLSESIKVSINNINSEKYVFFLADMPNIKVESIDKLFNYSSKGIIVFRKDDLITVPTVINKKYKDELLKLYGDKGAKKVIMKHLDDCEFIDVSNEEIFDIDTPEDLKR